MLFFFINDKKQLLKLLKTFIKLYNPQNKSLYSLRYF